MRGPLGAKLRESLHEALLADSKRKTLLCQATRQLLPRGLVERQSSLRPNARTWPALTSKFETDAGSPGFGLRATLGGRSVKHDYGRRTIGEQADRVGLQSSRAQAPRAVEAHHH